MNYITIIIIMLLLRLLLTAEAWVRFQANPCEICGGYSDTGTGFSQSTSFFPCQYHSTNAPYSSTYCSYQKDKRPKHGNLPKSNYLSEIGEHWIEKCYILFSFFRTTKVNIVTPDLNTVTVTEFVQKHRTTFMNTNTRSSFPAILFI